MRSRALATLLAVCASVPGAASSAATATSVPPALPPLVDPEPGWHIIRPGDTLETLARMYLGDSRHWPEIHRLNPGIDDPHWIYPGRRIRVLLERPSTAPNAQVTALARRVEARPEPVPWRAADQGDLLLERDGLRTFEKASARLLFDDGTTATVSADSLVFIRRQTPARAPAPKKEIEVVLGQTDLEATKRSSFATPEIEIVVGGAKSSSKPAADGSLHSRARKSADSAQFMVYEGSAKVAAGGGAVDLAPGTGTVVAPKAPPAPAEHLLAAPALVEPAEGAELGRDEPVLRWAPVAGASAYVAELCADRDCGSVRERRTGLATTDVRLAEPLADGESYWRVTAVAASGLDGFPSAPRRLTAVDSARPPAPTVALLDPSGTPLAAGAIFASAPKVEVRAVDAQGQELSWKLLVDGEPSSPEELAQLGVSGRHEIVAVATDARGREARSAPLAFELDAASPWLEAPAAVDGHALVEPDEKKSKKSDEPPPAAEPCAAGLEVWNGNSWLALSCGGDAPTEVTLSGAETDLRLRTTRPAVLGERRMVPGGAEAALRLTDRGTGLALARLRVVPSPHRAAAGRSLLFVEVVDRAGRSTTLSWHVGPG